VIHGKFGPFVQNVVLECDMSMPTRPNRRSYPSDMTDEEWDIVADMIPVPFWQPTLQEPLHHPREMLDAIRYRTRTGCAWRSLPHDFPPWQTAMKCKARWTEDGTIDKMHDALVRRVRVAEGRAPEPTAGCIDSQSVKSSGNGGPGGFDGGKKVNGRKRHILVDVLGLVLVILITPANVQDRDAACPVLMEAHAAYRTLKHVWADGAYNGEGIAKVEADTGLKVEVVKHEEGHRGFAVLPRRWVVERTNAWFGRFRILNREYERTLASSRADVLLGMTMLMLRRLTVPAEERRDRR
jgi:transposase